MRSSSGAHFIALDHVRALAAFMVFSWHFIHAAQVPYDYVPLAFPLALLDEGYTGVSLFMTLSGYLFAKLLDGKRIHYGAFLWNRAVRLLPLLVAVIFIVGALKFTAGEDMGAYAWRIARGVIFPTIPNGGWSLTVEFHYYAILPLFLWMLRKSRWLPLSILAAAFALRLYLYRTMGEVQTAAYWTIAGRVDQFVLGMFVYHCRTFFIRRHVLVLSILAGFALFYWHFDLRGGFYQNRSYPSTNPIWLVLLSVEGLAYAIGIAWYDGSFTHSTAGLSRLVGRLGEYSYSIYLLHFFVVFRAARYVDTRIMDISSFYWACLWSALLFLLMFPAGYLSYRFIESPFLRLRKRYIATE